MDRTKHQLVAEIEELRAEVANLKAALRDAESESNQRSCGVAPPEEALRESEARFRSLCESSPIGIFYTDLMGRCLYTNARWQELAGLTLTESLEDGWSRAIHPDDRAAVFAKWNRCVREGRDFEKKFRFLKPQGEVCWVHARATAICNERGEAIGYVGTDEDISAAKLAESVRKQATVDLKQLNQDLEQRVQERTAELLQVNADLQRQVSREKLLGILTQKIRQSLDLNEILATAVNEVRQILQADRALIFQLASEGSGVVVQEAVLPEYPVTTEMRSADEWFSEACYRYYCQGQPRIVPDVAADEWASCLVEFMQSVSVKSKIVAPIVRHRKNDSPFVWGLLIVHACADYRQWQSTEAELLQQIANQMAIALQQAQLHHELQIEQKALRQSEALFRSLSESAPVGIFRNDPQGQCIYTNPRCRQITGATVEEMLGDGWQQFIYPEDLEKILPQRSVDITEKQSRSIELRHIHKDGSIRLCQVNAAPILSTAHELLGFVGTVEDITERRVVEQMKNEFIAIVSHELRTPLASIRGSLGLLAANVLSNEPETAKHMLDIATLETERLVRLVTDILDLERLESNRGVLDKQWCNAATLMQQAVEILQPLATEDGVTLECVPLPVQIWVEPDRLIQTLVNLLSNAIKFSSVGGKVTLTAQRQSNCILFQVRDQGRGIPPDKLDLVFGRFQQIDSSDSRDKGGTGLGLAICRNIVQQHGGQIWVESLLNQGSTFCFTIPMPLELD